MLITKFSKDAQKFLTRIPAKHRQQISKKISQLAENPYAQDCIGLKGHGFLRADSGEYRIIYRTEETMLFISIIGKRNDDEVYKALTRKH